MHSRRFPRRVRSRTRSLTSGIRGRFFTVGPVTVEVIEGDARETLPKWPGEADAWFLDGFSPAKNPELWSPEMMAEVWRHTAPGGTAATYTAAGFVRRGLADAGSPSSVGPATATNAT